MKRKKYDDYKYCKADYHNERISAIRKRCEKHAKGEIKFFDHEQTILAGSVFDVYFFRDDRGLNHRYLENRKDRRHFILV